MPLLSCAPAAHRTSIDDVAAAVPPSQMLLLRLAPTARWLSIRTNDERIARYVRTSYPELIADRVPPATADRGIIETGPEPATVTFNDAPLPKPGPQEDGGPWSSGAYLTDQFVWRSLARDPLWLSVYACTVALDGEAVIIVGPSGSGKTTLALAFALRGAQIYGDEITLIHRVTGRVATISRRLLVREKTLSVLGDSHVRAIVTASLHDGAGSDRTFSVDRDAVNPRAHALRPDLPLRALVVLRRRGDGFGLQAISRARAAIAAARFFGSRTGDLTNAAALIRSLDGAQTFALSVDDPHEAAAQVAGAVAQC